MANSTKILLLCCLLGGCGSKGDLYLPPSNAPEADVPEDTVPANELKANLLEVPVSPPESESSRYDG
ncbi:MAG: lipoprotein [Kangiellaceae bacterium]|nr:lipoprotein [Kangiellaceae bacterium]